MIKIFFVALLIRVVVYLFMLNFYGNPSFMTFDSWEYFYNSQDLIVWKNATDYIGYNLWYERTPAYTLFLYLIRPENVIVIQIILSAIGVLFMYKMNKIAGWIFCLYPVSIFNSFQFMKQTLFTTIIIILIYILSGERYKDYELE